MFLKSYPIKIIILQIPENCQEMSEPMDLEEDMLRPPSPGMKEYEAEFPALNAGPDNKVSEVDLNFSLLDTNDEDRIVSHDGKVFSLDKGGLTFMSKNEISPPVKKPSYC